MPPRLHVLHRPGTSLHVILRTGAQKKKKVSSAWAWDWATDEITLGQWLGGRIYPLECDLSPDGQWMYYNALNAKWDDEATLGCFGALSRAPYLKAVTLWPVGNRWMPGMLIKRWGRRARTRAAYVGAPALPEAFTREFYLISGFYPQRLRRDGWTKRKTVKRPGRPDFHGTPVTDRVSTFSRPIRGAARLHRIHHVEPLGAGPTRYDTHAIVDTGGANHPRPGWQWAQVDEVRGRLLWAEEGRLWAGRIGRRGLPEDPTLLYDFNGLRFARKVAPY